ncbi:NAD(P)-binding protein [Daldinia caldariorum]|uniref:NAD(P)-binding protein n=1 Tax=Daldinia caldariorum TaxID=326644 RepID=UPI002007BB65|nr:NAD(P)-binding protein [Daldinia caldariorum]KAI1471906.1 NAD(P)-binding protein [Daldinia caldariorum]
METPEAKPYNLPDDAVWLITGCSSGIGQALAQHIATAHPAQRVVATARNPSSLSAIPDGPNVLKLALDVTSTASIDAAFAAALAAYARVDVVVNNAGYNVMGDAEASPAGNGAARALMDANFWGAVDVSKRALPVFRDVNPNAKSGGQGGRGGGVIVNVSSLGGFLGSPGNAFYHASKFALEGFAESLAKEVLPEWNVHVCCVEPGGVRTSYATTALARRLPRRHAAYDRADGPTTRMLAFMDALELHAGFASAGEIAEKIYEVVGGGRKIPIRVPLGKDSWGMVMAETEKVRRELEEWKEFSCAVGNPEVEGMAKLVK